MSKRKNTATKKLKVIPLGGLREIGKNMCVVEYENDIIIIDCGLTFPDEDMPGVDVVIPDTSYLERNQSKIRGILITHGHEDHYGAVPYILQKIRTNVYCTALTAGLLENKFKEFGLNPNVIKRVKVKETVRLGAFSCEFIRVAHSIPDSCAIAVRNPVGTILFTGDFKFDFTPIDNEPTDIHRLSQIGDEGVLALYSDSTNVERPGYTMSERTVGRTFKGIFAEAGERIIVATFASNLHRIQQIIWASEANHRHVALSGRSMINNVQVARELGYLKVKKGTLIDIADSNNYRPSQVCLLITGSQGEPMSALSRMANGEHKEISISPTDTIILSASAIPGNEKSIGSLINKLSTHDCRVIYQALAQVHVSGHACQEEHKLMHSLVHENYFIPAHGESRMLTTHMHLAESLGIPRDHILLGENGTVFEFEKKGGRIRCNMENKVQAGQVLVDGLGVGDVGSVVLNDRKRLAENGIISIVITLDQKSRRIVAGPEIISRGFVYMKDNIDLIEEIKAIVIQIFEEAGRRHITDWTYLKSQVRQEVRDYVYSEIQRDPIILSIIMETEGNYVVRSKGRN